MSISPPKTRNRPVAIKDPRRKKHLIQLLHRLGLTDLSKVNWSLLHIALIHPSVSPDNNYEQLEFVGDAVIRLVCAELLLETYYHLPVGEFAAIRSVVVSDRFLAEIAEEYGIERYLLISLNLRNDPGGRYSRLADAFEAILGALYESTKDMSLIRPWLDPILAEKSAEVHADPARQNYKDALQDWTQRKYQLLPTYKTKFNPDFAQPQERFISEVWLKDKLLGTGKGGNKKNAQQSAAQEAFSHINE